MYIILSYSYKISDKLDHFDILELNIRINKNVKEALAQIEECLSDYQVDIKQMKRPKKEEREEDNEVVHIVGHYNKKGFKKNELLRNISLIENIQEVLEEEN